MSKNKRKHRHGDRLNIPKKIGKPKSIFIPKNPAPGKVGVKITEFNDKVKTICSRCNDDGFWHSTKTGVRAKTSSEPLIDKTRKCPACGGISRG